MSVWIYFPDGKGRWGTFGQLSEYEPAVCPGGQEGQWHPGLCLKWCSKQGQEGDHPPVLSTGESVNYCVITNKLFVGV